MSSTSANHQCAERRPYRSSSEPPKTHGPCGAVEAIGLSSERRRGVGQAGRSPAKWAALDKLPLQKSSRDGVAWTHSSPCRVAASNSLCSPSHLGSGESEDARCSKADDTSIQSRLELAEVQGPPGYFWLPVRLAWPLVYQVTRQQHTSPVLMRPLL